MKKLPPALVAAMYADYCRPMSLHALGRKYGRDRRSIREVFVCRKLAVRTSPNASWARLPNGQVAPAVPLTPAEIEQLIVTSPRVMVPAMLKREWRSWSWARRQEFINRLRAHHGDEQARPTTPFSANVEPFDYASPRAHAIARAVNAGGDSRQARTTLKTPSQGVIFEGQLWFWNRKAGYQLGLWTPAEGRPVLHKLLWERHHGRPVPPSHVIRFADGNRNNLAPENLLLCSRNEVARENQAAALFRKSRAQTALLLARAQSGAGVKQIRNLRRRHGRIAA